MKNTDMRHRRRQNGFVLVTSLIFLVVITLLAVSAMNSATIQERMASNLREKSRARQAADSALRQGELLLSGNNLATYKPAGGCYGSSSSDSSSCTAADSLRIWRQGAVLGNGVTDTSAAYLADSVWDQQDIQKYSGDQNLEHIEFIVEEMTTSLPDDLNASTNAQGIGKMLYRITAKAEGENPAATAVTQSVFAKRYYGAN